MSWRAITETDLLQRISGDELAAIRESALADDQDDPVAGHISQVTDFVRGYIAACAANTLGEEGTLPERLIRPACDILLVDFFSRVAGMLIDLNDTRQKARDAAIRLLEQVAACSYAIEQPTTAGTEVESAPSPSFGTPAHTYQRTDQDGL